MINLLIDVSAATWLIDHDLITEATGRYPSNSSWSSATHELLGDRGPIPDSLQAWLGRPYVVDDPAAIAEIERIRRTVFGGAADQPLEWLDAAENLWLIRNHPACGTALWLTRTPLIHDFGRRSGMSVVSEL